MKTNLIRNRIGSFVGLNEHSLLPPSQLSPVSASLRSPFRRRGESCAALGRLLPAPKFSLSFFCSGDSLDSVSLSGTFFFSHRSLPGKTKQNKKLRLAFGRGGYVGDLDAGGGRKSAVPLVAD